MHYAIFSLRENTGKRPNLLKCIGCNILLKWRTEDPIYATKNITKEIAQFLSEKP